MQGHSPQLVSKAIRETTIGKKLLRERLARMITQKELNAACGFATNTIARIERGLVTPTREQLLIICQKLHVPPRVLDASALHETGRDNDELKATKPKDHSRTKRTRSTKRKNECYYGAEESKDIRISTQSQTSSAASYLSQIDIVRAIENRRVAVKVIENTFMSDQDRLARVLTFPHKAFAAA